MSDREVRLEKAVGQLGLELGDAQRAQLLAYLDLIAASGLVVEQIRANPYEFLSDQARNASTTYGVKSVSLLAVKPATG